ncbi:tRNA (adenine37-N(6))-methyltransferase TrmN6 [hydrothermal vent metagenome]|uniref:tRNA (Adenine37-N(6))-methyltransferase TrmN6 n=1 Tax=hydrothermal vent metagenome TaxID=652676 RepID=A0A1W1EIF0_9ZZZZ
MLFYQPINGYCYNSDSIFLYQFISSFNIKGNLLDIGCGVGVISGLLKRDFNVEVTLIDKQLFMLKYAKKNFEIASQDVTAHLGDFIDYKFDNSFDFVISNPPFYSSSVTQSNNENINIARYSHHLPIEEFINGVKRILKPRGWFIFCYDAKQIDLLLYHLKRAKINPEVIEFVYSKIDRDSKLVMIACRNGSKSQTKINPPFIVFDGDNNYQEKAKRAFEMANTHSIKGEFIE